jgi:hypothetical protein
MQSWAYAPSMPTHGAMPTRLRWAEGDARNRRHLQPPGHIDPYFCLSRSWLTRKQPSIACMAPQTPILWQNAAMGPLGLGGRGGGDGGRGGARAGAGAGVGATAGVLGTCCERLQRGLVWPD